MEYQSEIVKFDSIQICLGKKPINVNLIWSLIEQEALYFHENNTL